MTSSPRRPGFTLIELLLVIAIIALLVGILLPSLSSARQEGRAIKCAASIRAVGQGVQIYATDYKFMPPGYVYPDETDGFKWTLNKQFGSGSDTGYLHWSYSLFNNGQVPGDAFQCPTVWKGGAPRANPGVNIEDWETGQNNDVGGTAGAAEPTDRQVPRIAYTANDAIISRNKYVNVARPYRMVRPADIDATRGGASKTILLTEFLANYQWKSLTVGVGETVIKSHRSVQPFIGGQTGSASAFTESIGGNAPRFFYPKNERIRLSSELGEGMIEANDSVLNAVGRHHPAEKGPYGGTVNFAFVDGHVERLRVLETVEKRLWGDRYFSLSGDNRVDLTTTK